MFCVGLRLACFEAGTPVEGEHGSVPVEQINAGDRVWARGEHDPAGPVELKVVEETFERYAQVLRVRAGGATIGTTAEHPFWVAGTGWVNAGELRPGDRFVGRDGQVVAVAGVEDTGAWARVYNLRVADHHTYFVGAPDWGLSAWAHNAYFGPGQLSELVRGGSLAGHEAAGGHTLVLHVGQTVGALRARLAAQPWITAASTFYNRRIAELAVSRSLASHAAGIGTWLAGTAPRLRIDFNTGHNVGVTLQPPELVLRFSAGCRESRACLPWPRSSIPPSSPRSAPAP